MEATGTRRVKVSLEGGRTGYFDPAKSRCWKGCLDGDYESESKFRTFLYRSPSGHFVEERRYYVMGGDHCNCGYFGGISLQEATEWFAEKWEPPPPPQVPSFLDDPAATEIPDYELAAVYASEAAPHPYESEIPAEVAALLMSMDLDAASPPAPASPPRPKEPAGRGTKAPPTPVDEIVPTPDPPADGTPGPGPKPPGIEAPAAGPKSVDDIVAELRKNSLRTPAALVEFMSGRKFATFEEIAECVHRERLVSDGTIKGNVSRTNEHLAGMRQPLRFRVGSRCVFPDDPPA